LEVDLLFELNRLPVGQGGLWPEFNVLLVRRILDAGLVEARKPQVFVTIGGMSAAPLTLFITKKGNDFVRAVSTDGDLHY
jgi:hypothetical protein